MVHKQKEGGSIMKNRCLTLSVLVFLLAAGGGSMDAQASEQTCVIVLTGQNRARTVAGVIDQECGGGWHSAPFGNWGVSSNYGPTRDTDQFRGWKHLDGPSTKRQWNSCTSFYPPPDCDYYNSNHCRTQQSYSTVTHGTMVYRTSVEECTPDVPGAPPTTYYGCQDQGGSVGQTSNYMTLYELDWDGDDLVETLYFPGTSATLTGCDYDGCPEKTSGWVDMTRSTSSEAIVEAELRMKARAYLEGSCDWN